jgi:hypothetical protein
MATITDNAARTAYLLALMKKGDDAFNARDFAAVDTVHHPDMVAHITGNARPIYGSVAHAAAMETRRMVSRCSVRATTSCVQDEQDEIGDLEGLWWPRCGDRARHHRPHADAYRGKT